MCAHDVERITLSTIPGIGKDIKWISAKKQKLSTQLSTVVFQIEVIHNYQQF
jgi:hypothetical protein